MSRGKKLTATMKATGAVAVTAVIALGLSACGTEVAADSRGFEECIDAPSTCNSGEPADGGTINWGIVDSWAGWNPLMATYNAVGTSKVLSPIYPITGRYNPDGEWIYNDGILAQEPIKISDDPLIVSYKLNDDANWGDDWPISVDDFIYSWYAFSGDKSLCEGCEPTTTSWGGQVENISENGGSIEVEYKKGYATPEWKEVDSVLTMPQHIASKAGFDWKADPKAMAASLVDQAENVPKWSAGPYKIKDTSVGEWVQYEPNPKWAGSAGPYLDELNIRVFATTGDMVTALRNEEIDGAAPSEVTSANLSMVQSSEEISYNVASGPSWEHIDANVDSTFLGDQVLREAVFTAIDVELLVDTIAGGVTTDISRKTNHLFPNDYEGAEDQLSTSFQGSGDTGQARILLEEAGYVYKDDDLYTPTDENTGEEGERVALQISFNGNNVMRSSLVQMMQSNLEDLGVEATIEDYGSDVGGKLGSGEWDLIIFGWSSDPRFASAPNQFWSSDSDSNFGHLNSPDVDALIAELETTMDTDTAVEISNNIVAEVVEEAYSLPIADLPVVVYANDKLVNVRDNWASPIRSLYNVAEWGVRSE